MPSLPIETWGDVFQWLSFKEHVPLCLVSKTFYINAIREIYSRVVIDGSPLTVKLCSAVINNDRAAVAVQSVFIIGPMSYRTMGRQCELRAYLDLTVRMLRRTVNVEVLAIHTAIPEHAFPIEYVTFPRLSRFMSRAPFGRSVSSFLSRHPTLKHLHLERDNTLNWVSTDHYDFPRLVYYSGPASLVGAIIPGAPVRSVETWWSTAEYRTHIRGIMDAFAGSTGPIMSLELSQSDGWSIDVLDAISRYIAHLSLLTLFGFFGHEVLSDPGIPHALSRMGNLRTLNIVSSLEENRDLTWQFHTTLLWGIACPSLDSCLLPGWICWRRRGKKVWLPASDNGVFPDWIREMLINESPERVDAFLQTYAELFNRDRTHDQLSTDEQETLDTLFLPK